MMYMKTIKKIELSISGARAIYETLWKLEYQGHIIYNIEVYQNITYDPFKCSVAVVASFAEFLELEREPMPLLALSQSAVELRPRTVVVRKCEELVVGLQRPAHHRHGHSGLNKYLYIIEAMFLKTR